MAKLAQLKAEERKLLGRKVKSLRGKGLIPANIFGKNVKSTAISVGRKDFEIILEKEGETGLFEIILGKLVRPVLIANTQVHPVTGDILHVDFRQVNLKEKVSAEVPVRLVGEAPAEKQGLIVNQSLNAIEVEALPLELPEEFEVDISKLSTIDDQITVADLDYDRRKITIDIEDSQIVVNVVEPQKEEVEAPAPEAVDVEGGGAEEGQDSAEGEQTGTSEEK